jgi:hypothetical protein
MTMPKISSWMTRALLASFAMISLLASAAWAQQPPTVRIRGTIEGIDGPMLMIKTREGTGVKVKMTDDLSVIGIAKTSLSEIKPGNSTMTNATVAETVAGVDGQVIQVKYKDGEKKVVVPPDAAIVAFVTGEKSEVKPRVRKSSSSAR